jgi:hypothetical protein
MTEGNIPVIPLKTLVCISYDLPDSPDRQYITIEKEDTDDYRRKLREIEEELAEKKATGIVYVVTTDYD